VHLMSFLLVLQLPSTLTKKSANEVN